MTIETEIDTGANRMVIKIEGPFGFSLVNDFRSSYEGKDAYNFTIDMRQVDYIDSAGLGMLLNMQSYLGKSDLDIRIINTLPQVKKILMISRFDKKFMIE